MRTPVPEPGTIPNVNGNGKGSLKVPDGKIPDLEKKPELSRGRPLPDATGTPNPPQDLELKSSTSRAEEIKSRMNELKKSIEFLVWMCFFQVLASQVYISEITLQACILYTCVVAMLRQRSGWKRQRLRWSKPLQPTTMTRPSSCRHPKNQKKLGNPRLNRLRKSARLNHRKHLLTLKSHFLLLEQTAMTLAFVFNQPLFPMHVCLFAVYTLSFRTLLLYVCLTYGSP